MNGALSLTSVFQGVAVVLLLSLLAGLLRVWKGPRAEDRMLAAQLFGTTGVGILIVLAAGTDTPALRDVALILAVLAVLAVVAFVGRVGAEPERESHSRHEDNPDASAGRDGADT